MRYALSAMAIVCLATAAPAQDLLNRVAQLEQAVAQNSRDLAQVKSDVAEIRKDLAEIKARLAIGTTTAPVRTAAAPCSAACACGCNSGGDCPCVEATRRYQAAQANSLNAPVSLGYGSSPGGSGGCSNGSCSSGGGVPRGAIFGRWR